ncbi:MAG TPA: hypothetical protein VFL72_04420 [Acidimicrobiia bacterium]|nr:hypothetical protein [Acidimicrobiia bacterium]
MMVVFAPAALAHHPEIDAYQTCLDQGLVIHFDAISWRTDGGSGSGHSDIRIEVRVNGSGAWVEVESGAFTDANDYRFSGNFDASPYLGQNIEVRARADGPWDNGQGGGETRQTTAFAVDLNCDEDATPVDPVITGSEACGVADSLVVPNTPGVNYLLGNDVVNGDTITGPASGVITAAPQDGFELTDPSWSFAFELGAGDPCPGVVDPVDPVVTISEVCGVADSLVVPNTPGVNYLLGNDVVNGDTITGAASGVITAVAQAGFELTDPSWSFTFDLEAGDPCPGVVTPVAPSIVASTVCEVQGSVSFPVTTGIRYVVNGVDVSGQTLAGPISGTVLVETQPGYVLSDGAPTQMAFAVAAADVCDEVLGEEIDPDDVTVLPLTGIDSEALLGVSILLLGMGIYLIHIARRGEEG